MSFKSGVKGRRSDRWCERRRELRRGDVNQEESEQNEVDGADSTGGYLKEQLMVIFNDTDGHIRVTTYERSGFYM